jgi:hypothetical protein
VSALVHEHRAHRRVSITKAAAVLGLIGGSLGLVAGFLELTAGPSIRSWVGNKADTTRLGLATLVLAGIALAAALVLARRQDASAPLRLGLAIGFLLPGLICFTTVGQLWYLPGALLLTAAALGAGGLRKDTRQVAAALDHNWPAILTVALAAFYIFLGATALGIAGGLGIVGGIVVLVLVVARGKVPTWLGIAVLVLAALPFAALTWWSVTTPPIALLLFGIGVFALRESPR